MSNDKPTEIKLDEAPEHPMAAAVHTDTIWGGPRWVHHATEKPVWCETKEDYWRLLSTHGFQMHDQAESTTKFEHLREAAPIPKEFTPSPVRQPMSMGEAHLWACADAVFQARDFHCVVLTCLECYTRNRFEWCQIEKTAKRIAITCKCGTFGYTPPMGTTDFGGKIPTLALKSEAPTIATLMSPDGSQNVVPAEMLSDTEALILKAWVKMLRGRELEPHIYHIGCFNGDPQDVSNEVGMKVSHDEIVLICPCKLLAHTSVRKYDSLTTTH